MTIRVLPNVSEKEKAEILKRWQDLDLMSVKVFEYLYSNGVRVQEDIQIIIDNLWDKYNVSPG